MRDHRRLICRACWGDGYRKIEFTHGLARIPCRKCSGSGYVGYVGADTTMRKETFDSTDGASSLSSSPIATSLTNPQCHAADA